MSMVTVPAYGYRVASDEDLTRVAEAARHAVGVADGDRGDVVWPFEGFPAPV